MTRDAKLILMAQGVRAFVYGLGSVLVGVSLAEAGLSSAKAGIVLAAMLAGAAAVSAGVGLLGDRLGRRRTYGGLFLLMGAAGAAFAVADSFPWIVLAALAGTISTDVVESGPFTSLEVAMIPQATRGPEERNRTLGTYNAVATLVGSVGALAAGGPEILREWLPGLPPDRRFLLLYPVAGVVGALVAGRLSPGVDGVKASGPPLGTSRRRVTGLAGLFAVDSFAGGFVVQSFIAFWLRERFGTPAASLGLIFFAVGLLQSLSFLLAVRIARLIGLLRTMVFTHLPSNLLLAAVPLAPSFGWAIALLLARFALAQMDVPTRQAYLAALVRPEERTAAAAFTNSARTAVRPLGPVVGGALFPVASAGPFLVAGALKAIYDVSLFLAFRGVRLEEETGPGRLR